MTCPIIHQDVIRDRLLRETQQRNRRDIMEDSHKNIMCHKQQSSVDFFFF